MNTDNKVIIISVAADVLIAIIAVCSILISILAYSKAERSNTTAEEANKIAKAELGILESSNVSDLAIKTGDYLVYSAMTCINPSGMYDAVFVLHDKMTVNNLGGKQAGLLGIEINLDHVTGAFSWNTIMYEQSAEDETNWKEIIFPVIVDPEHPRIIDYHIIIKNKFELRTKAEVLITINELIKKDYFKFTYVFSDGENFSATKRIIGYPQLKLDDIKIFASCDELNIVLDRYYDKIIK